MDNHNNIEIVFFYYYYISYST